MQEIIDHFDAQSIDAEYGYVQIAVAPVMGTPATTATTAITATTATLGG
ncbi:hypothetical protein RIF23_18480 [Lipingzhangella sp. LS1_29]|uniref:Uncharacterized protein n=1 Tax=Lipingzhangella rawalii TaxID=2055835 RepID=A0ABU2HBT9_9ACTN|nr:hypothetical protein [Lipingzhangella rawalii]MDS1272280.1 hypothetical protein [Lipingzhangella rawalii]